LLGFLQETKAQWQTRKRSAPGIDVAKVEALVAARTRARKARNFAESDRIRDELKQMGVVLHDTKDGTTWEIAR